MDDRDRDVEVFERIPWEALEGRPDRRWLAYLVAGALVLGAVGVSVGRQIGSPSPPTTGLSPASTGPAPSLPVEEAPEVALPPPTTTLPSPTTWSEADLLALPPQSLEAGAAAVAEWYVVDFLTRDGPDDGRSFVEWLRASEIDWRSPSAAEVTVLVRRLAARGDDPYQRLGTEAWVVRVDLEEKGWVVVPPPAPGEPPQLTPGTEAAETAVEWTDAAGLVWQVGAGEDG